MGKTTTKKVTRGPNKGDTVQFKKGPSGKPYPVKTVKDTGAKRKGKLDRKKKHMK